MSRSNRRLPNPKGRFHNFHERVNGKQPATKAGTTPIVAAIRPSPASTAAPTVRKPVTAKPVSAEAIRKRAEADARIDTQITAAIERKAARDKINVWDTAIQRVSEPTLAMLNAGGFRHD